MDRFIRGFSVGVLAGIVKDLLSLFSRYVLHLAELLYADFMGVILLGHRVKTISDFITCQLLELAYCGFIGVLFIVFAYRTYNKRNLWFKGIFFGEIAFLFAYALGSLFKLPGIKFIPSSTAISQFITSAVYGALLGLGVYWWGKKSGDFSGVKNN